MTAEEIEVLTKEADGRSICRKKYNKIQWLQIICKSEFRSTFPCKCFNTLNQDWIATLNSVLVGLSQEIGAKTRDHWVKFQPLSHTGCQRPYVSPAALNYGVNVFANTFYVAYLLARRKKVVTEMLHYPILKSVLCMELTYIYFQNTR